MSTKELCWHLYRAGSLCQFGDIEARRVEVETIKAEYELPTRRRLMKRVVGELPSEFVEACAQEEAAREIWEAWDARKARDAAWKAWKAQEARNAAYSKHKVEIEALHAEECPNCPWDGETIFPR